MTRENGENNEHLIEFNEVLGVKVVDKNGKQSAEPIIGNQRDLPFPECRQAVIAYRNETMNVNKEKPCRK